MKSVIVAPLAKRVQVARFRACARTSGQRRTVARRFRGILGRASPVGDDTNFNHCILGGTPCSSASSASATSRRTRPPVATPTEAERIASMTQLALKAEEVGLDVFATGEHHNPPFVVVLADDAPRLHRGEDREAAALHEHHADHHQRPGEDRRGLRLPAAPLRRPRRPDDGSRQHRPGLPVVRQGHPRRHQARGRELPPAPQALARAGRQLAGRVPYAAAGLHLDAGAARRHAAVRLARLDPQHRDRRAGGLLRRRLLPQPHLLEQGAHRADGEALPPPLRALRPRRRRPGLRRAGRTGLHGRDRGRGQAGLPSLLRQRPGLRPRPVDGGLHRDDAADRRHPRAGHRAHPRLRRLRR